MSIVRCDLCGKHGNKPYELPSCSRQDCPRVVAVQTWKKALSPTIQQDSMTEEFCPQCYPCKYAAKITACEDAMREIAFYLGVGGYNAMEFDPTVFKEKIIWGINHHLKVKAMLSAAPENDDE